MQIRPGILWRRMRSLPGFPYKTGHLRLRWRIRYSRVSKPRLTKQVLDSLIASLPLTYSFVLPAKDLLPAPTKYVLLSITIQSNHE